MGPLQHRAGLILREQFQSHELAEHGAAEGLGEDLDLVEAKVQEGAFGPEGAIGDEQMEMRMEVHQAAVGLDASDDDPRDDAWFAEGRAHEVAEGAVSDAAQLSEESAVVQEEGPQALGNGEHVLPELASPGSESLGTLVEALGTRMQEIGDRVMRFRRQTVEPVNAQIKRHGVGRFHVRKLPRCVVVLTLACIAHNLTKWKARETTLAMRLAA